MKEDEIDLVEKIIHLKTGQDAIQINPILGYGSVNQIYAVLSKKQDYVVRLNGEDKAKYEFPKEQWCLEAAAKLGIPSPIVLGIGYLEGYSYMLQNRIEGQNGTLCTETENLEIWETLGRYTRSFSALQCHGYGFKINTNRIAEFSSSWERHIAYNLSELTPDDPLLKNKVLSKKEQDSIRGIVDSLRKEKFSFGLVHGDLSLRNVIVQRGKVFLLDWGTAAIDVAPHGEFVCLLENNEITTSQMARFLKGLGLDKALYKKMESTIQKLRLLNSLDKYRWALGQPSVSIELYEKKIRKAYF